MEEFDQMKTCLFCNPAFKTKSQFWENTFFYAIFDDCPVSPGHALLIPHEHIPDLHTLTNEAWNTLKDALHEVSTLIERTDLTALYQQMVLDDATAESIWFVQQALQNPHITTKPDAYNYGINDGEAAGRTISHLHLHVIPRYTGDVDDPRGGVRYVLPEMGNYKIKRG